VRKLRQLAGAFQVNLLFKRGERVPSHFPGLALKKDKVSILRELFSISRFQRKVSFLRFLRSASWLALGQKTQPRSSREDRTSSFYATSQSAPNDQNTRPKVRPLRDRLEYGALKASVPRLIGRPVRKVMFLRDLPPQ
jgi:hypothetical protein